MCLLIGTVFSAELCGSKPLVHNALKKFKTESSWRISSWGFYTENTVIFLAPTCTTLVIYCSSLASNYSSLASNYMYFILIGVLLSHMQIVILGGRAINM